MDDYSITGPRMFKALDELKTINKYLGGAATTRAGIDLFRNREAQKKLTVLDLGAGGSDVFDSIPASEISVCHLDINTGIVKRIRTRRQNAHYVCADAAVLCFKEKSFDLIHLSLFLHHFTPEQQKVLITGALKTARHGIVINDLQRNILAFLGIKLLVTLFSKSDMVKNDGPLSVRKAFVKKDLSDLLDSLKVNYVIKRKWAFRWLVCIFLTP